MHAEERISKLEDKTTEIILSEEHKDERKNEKSLSNLWDTSMEKIDPSLESQREKSVRMGEKIREMTDSSPYLMRDTNIQV